MASDLNVVKRERLSVLRSLDQALRTTDTQIEFLQRLLKRQRARRKKLPTFDDYKTIVLSADKLDDAWTEFVKVLRAGQRIYQRIR